MKIIVTGGAGFIGSNVSDALVGEGHNVVIVDNLSTGKEENINPGAQFYNVDITDEEALEDVFKSFEPEVVFHIAAQIDVRKSVEDPAFDAEVNVVGSVNVFRMSVQYGVRRVVLSSTGGALYGEAGQLPASEGAPVEPISPYGVSKYCAENYLNYFKRLYGLRDRHASLRSAHDDKEERSVGIERVILRYANVYGPRQDPLGEAGVVAIFTRKILDGESPTIFGDGTQTRDYIFIEDVVKSNLLALSGKEGTYNIGTGRETSVNELVEMFSKIVGKEIKPEYTSPRIGEVTRISLNGDLAKRELGFEAKYSLEEGIKKTIDWYRGK